MIMDFWRTRSKLNTVSILGEEVEVEEEYRYLGSLLGQRCQMQHRGCLQERT